MNPAIIGGGYAGMAAAVTLSSNGVPVTVFDNAPQLGGRARAVLRHGTLLDNGQHILMGCYAQTLRLIEQVGGDVERDFLRLPLQLALHDTFHFRAARLPAPLHVLIGLLTARGATLESRLEAVRFMRAMRRLHFRLPQDMAASELLRAYRQGELIRLLWEPVCLSALNTPIDRASAQVLLNVLRDSLMGGRSASDMLLPRIDLSTLFPDRAGKFVSQHGGSVHTGCGVEAIEAGEGGMILHTPRGEVRYSHVVCATSPTAAARLLDKMPQLSEVATRIGQLSFQPIYTVYLQYPDMVCLPQPMLGLHQCCAQWLFDRGRIAGQQGLIAAVISAEGAHQEWAHEKLAHIVARELAEKLGIAGPPLWYQVIAEKRATFSCEVNTVRPAHPTPQARLFLAGDYTDGEYPATLEGAVRSGIACAQAIISGREQA